MRAWLLESFEGIDKLRLAEVPEPQPGAGAISLEVKFAALNPADAFLAEALYPAKPPLPHILGRDGVGTVAALGAGVNHLRVGDVVGILRCECGVETWGTLGERVIVPAASVIPVPKGWSLEQTAAAPLVFLTAMQALTQWSDPPAPPAAGAVVMVSGASGGVGVATVLLAKAMGLTVCALSRSADKRAKLKALGADYTFDPEDANLRKAITADLAPRKVDLVVDSVGGAPFNEMIAVLGLNGRVSVVGRSAGAVPQFNTAMLLFRRNRIGGVAVSAYTPEAAQVVWRDILAYLAKTGQRPVIDSVFPFADVKQAFARLAHGPMGKVLVRVGDES